MPFATSVVAPPPNQLAFSKVDRSDPISGERPAYRVLLIEDNPVDAMRIRQLLARCRSARFSVESTATLTVAQERLAAGSVDVALLDLDLPDSLGADTYLALAGINPQVPVLILSGAAGEAVAFEAVRLGAQDVLLKASLSPDGLARTTRCAVERQRLLSSLRGLSLTDDLTGLLNRRGFATVAQGQLRLASRTGHRFLLFFADLDGLKGINDTYGHQEGDNALIRIGDVLRRTFRQSDVVGRLGGDEFAMLALDTSRDEGATVRKRLTANLEAESGDPYRLSVSLGILSFDAALDEPLGALLARADRELYRDKRSRRR